MNDELVSGMGYLDNPCAGKDHLQKTETSIPELHETFEISQIRFLSTEIAS